MASHDEFDYRYRGLLDEINENLEEHGLRICSEPMCPAIVKLKHGTEVLCEECSEENAENYLRRMGG